MEKKTEKDTCIIVGIHPQKNSIRILLAMNDKGLIKKEKRRKLQAKWRRVARVHWHGRWWLTTGGGTRVGGRPGIRTAGMVDAGTRRDQRSVRWRVAFAGAIAFASFVADSVRIYRVDLGARKVAPVRGLDCGLWDWGLVEKGAVAYNLHDRRMTQRGLKRGGGRADARPCGVGEYLYWYVSGKCGKMEE